MVLDGNKAKYVLLVNHTIKKISIQKYMKIKFNSDDELPLNKMIEVPSMILVVRAVFLENNK